MNSIKFLGKGLTTFRTTGALTRSSRFLCQQMVRNVDYENAKVIVELGAGDGVITKHILDRMGPNTKLLVFEIQPSFCELLNKINDDRMVVIEDSAEHLAKYLKEHGYDKADAIISAIPFVILPKPLVEKIVMTCRDNLAKGGSFTQFHYSTVLKSIYGKVFDKVRMRFVARNIPPAFVFKCSMNE